MAKTTIQGASATEFVIMVDGKQGIFSHADKDVCTAKLSALRAHDHANGCERNYTKHTRVVSYPDLKEFPSGEESQRSRSEVTESKGWN